MFAPVLRQGSIRTIPLRAIIPFQYEKSMAGREAPKALFSVIGAGERTRSLRLQYSLRVHRLCPKGDAHAQTFRVLSRNARRRIAPVTNLASLVLCRGEDSNLHGLLRLVLSQVRLPISPPRRVQGYLSMNEYLPTNISNVRPVGIEPTTLSLRGTCSTS